MITRIVTRTLLRRVSQLLQEPCQVVLNLRSPDTPEQCGSKLFCEIVVKIFISAWSSYNIDSCLE